MTTEYLTMWEASKVCSYSQEYLSLLSRRQLLKAVKKENKWLTTMPWLTEYLADKKPDEVIISRRKATQLFDKKRGEFYGKYWVMAITVVIAIFLVLIAAVAIFSQMSDKISELEAEARKNAVSQANADALAGFDPSVLEAKSPPQLDSQVPK